MQYLHDRQYYIDRYDLFTIKRCLSIINVSKSAYQQSLSDKEFKKITKKEKQKGFLQIMNQMLYFTKAEEFKDKNKTIEEWMLADERKQLMYDRTNPPKETLCEACGGKLKETFKLLKTTWISR
jgi:hypothetical protein